MSSVSTPRSSPDSTPTGSSAERSRALDLLGFDRQWVFVTLSTGEIFRRLTAAGDHEVVAGALAAHNRGMAEFCTEDDRLLGVGAATLDDRIPEAAISTSRGVVFAPTRLRSRPTPASTAIGCAPARRVME